MFSNILTLHCTGRCTFQGSSCFGDGSNQDWPTLSSAPYTQLLFLEATVASHSNTAMMCNALHPTVLLSYGVVSSNVAQSVGWSGYDNGQHLSASPSLVFRERNARFQAPITSHVCALLVYTQATSNKQTNSWDIRMCAEGDVPRIPRGQT